MFIENLDELPESLRDQFVEHEFDGKKGYQPKSIVTLENTMRNVKAEKGELKTKLDEYESRLAEIEKAKKEEIEAAQAEAFEKAKKEGNVDAVDERWQQKLADAEKRKNDEIQSLQAKLDELTNGIKAEKRNAIVSDLASELAVPKGSKAFKALVANRIDVDPSTGELTFLDENGSATSLDLDGFKGELEKDELFAPLLKSGIVTSGGGGANGSGIGSAMTKPINQMSESERVEFKRRDPDGFRRAINGK